MGKDLSNPQFDYSVLKTHEASKLRYYEGELTKSRKRVADEVIKHGEILHEVQQLLASYSGGTFTAWLNSCGLSPRGAYNAIDAYLGFASFANLQNLEVSALYALAKNEKAKKRAMRLADKGVKVSHAMAKTLIAQFDEPADEPDPEPEDETPPFEPDADPLDSPELQPAEEPVAGPGPKNGKDAGDLGQCPACAGTRWRQYGDGPVCARCNHPHGEPAGEVEEDRIETQRVKTRKTVEAAMRAFDDLNMLSPGGRHDESIRLCKELWAIVEAW